MVLTPYHFYIQISCWSFCAELMDIIRLMAIDNNEKFENAWKIINHNEDIHLDGKRFKVETRFFYYPNENVRYFLLYRDVSVYLNLDLERTLSNDFTDYLLQQIQLLMPIYEFFLSAAKSIGKYPVDSLKLTRWSIHPSEYRKIKQEK